MRKKLAFLSVLIILVVALMGCAAKYNILFGVADWQHKNHLALQDRYDRADAEEKAYLEANVNPYMNIMKWAVIGFRAVDEENDIKLADAIERIVEIGAKVKYDPERLIVALRQKDLDTIEYEVVVLKNIILDKLGIVPS